MKTALIARTLTLLALLSVTSVLAQDSEREEGMGFMCSRSDQCPGVEICCSCNTYAGIIPVCTNEALCKVMGYCRVLA